MSKDKNLNEQDDEVEAGQGQADIADIIGSAGKGDMKVSKEKKSFKRLYEALLDVQMVCEPGKGRVGVPECFHVARAQKRLLNEWVESKEELSDIQAWIDGSIALTALPPARLQQFIFDVPALEDAVFQLTTQAKVGRVVLTTFSLRSVPPEGLEHIEEWDNDQKLRMSITRQDEMFKIEVAINPHRVQKRMVATASNTFAVGRSTAAQSDWLPRDKSGKKSSEGNGTLRSKAASVGFGLLRPAFVAIVTLLVLGVIGQVLTSREAHVMCASSNVNATQGTDKGDSKFSSQTEADAVSQASAGGDNTASENNQESLVDAGQKASMAETGEGGRGVKVRGSKERKEPRAPERTTVANGTQPGKPKGNAHSSELSGGTEQFSFTMGSQELANSPWNAQRFAKLAKLQKVFVAVDKAQLQRQAGSTKALNSFLRALEDSDRFSVVNKGDYTHADAVINLGFESDEKRLGAIFIDVRSPDGKFLWYGFVDCTPSQSSDQDAAYGTASEQLVNSFKEIVITAQENMKKENPLASGL